MYSDKQAFCIHFEDLETCLAEGSERALFRAAVPLRHLLMDGLVAKTNREVRHRLSFKVVHTDSVTVDATALPGDMMTFQSLDPYSSASQLPSMRMVERDLGDFLTMRAQVYDGRPMSVREYLGYVANKAGMIQKGERSDDNAKTLHELSSRVSFFNMPVGLLAMRDILAITIRALRPIYEAVRR